MIEKKYMDTFNLNRNLRILGCCFDMQELIVIDDLLSALIGIEGRYISIKRVRSKDDNFAFQVDASMDLALQVRMLPLWWWHELLLSVPFDLLYLLF